MACWRKVVSQMFANINCLYGATPLPEPMLTLDKWTNAKSADSAVTESNTWCLQQVTNLVKGISYNYLTFLELVAIARSICFGVYCNIGCPSGTHLNLSFYGQKSHPFADDIFICIFVNENFCISMKMSLKSVSKGSFDNNSALV